MQVLCGLQGIFLLFNCQTPVHDIKVIEGEKGLFIAMPSRKAADGEYRDIAHPINSDTRNMIQTLILEQYEAMRLGDIDATAPEI